MRRRTLRRSRDINWSSWWLTRRITYINRVIKTSCLESCTIISFSADFSAWISAAHPLPQPCPDSPAIPRNRIKRAPSLETTRLRKKSFYLSYCGSWLALIVAYLLAWVAGHLCLMCACRRRCYWGKCVSRGACGRDIAGCFVREKNKSAADNRPQRRRGRGWGIGGEGSEWWADFACVPMITWWFCSQLACLMVSQGQPSNKLLTNSIMFAIWR